MKGRSWTLASAGVVLGSVALATWLILTEDDGAPSLDAGNAALVAQGAQIYDEHCAVCHGAALEGQPDWQIRREDGRLPAPPHDETGHTWHHSDAVLFRMVKEGIEPLAPPGYESDMPAYEGVLSDREIVAVLSFIKAQWRPEIQARQEAIDRQSRR